MLDHGSGDLCVGQLYWLRKSPAAAGKIGTAGSSSWRSGVTTAAKRCTRALCLVLVLGTSSTCLWTKGLCVHAGEGTCRCRDDGMCHTCEVRLALLTQACQMICAHFGMAHPRAGVDTAPSRRPMTYRYSASATDNARGHEDNSFRRATWLSVTSQLSENMEASCMHLCRVHDDAGPAMLVPASR